MRFVSTRGGAEPVDFLGAVARGLAPDGGLFVPEVLPDVRPHLERWAGLGYAETAAEFLSLFTADPDAGAWRAITAEAYGRFDHPCVAPLKPLGAGRLRVLELFHGPTLAFKDFALQLLGLLYRRVLERRGGTLTVLGATSGDTGSAAIHGCLGLPGIRVFILYPESGVSPLQERQMACTGAPNVFPLAVPGTFDDAQRVVKTLFADAAFAGAQRLAAVNSINISRVLAQCVYTVRAWLDLPVAERDGVEFVVPTGNFGNVLAAWWASRMGLPVARFRVATNRNDILHRYFTAGDYRARAVEPSLAPSMDIQLASNFERYLYHRVGGRVEEVRRQMAAIAAGAPLPAGAAAPADGPGAELVSSRMGDEEIRRVIAVVHRETGMTVCPHTACGFAGLVDGDRLREPERPTVILATAHPAKFPETVAAVTGEEPKHPALEALKARPLVRHRVAATPEAVRAFIERA